MVSIHDGFVGAFYKVWSSNCESMDYSKKFLVVDVPVPLCGVESLGKESDRMELAFLIPLLKDSTNRKGRGITVNDELFFKLGLVQDRGSADSVDKGLECGIMFIIPVKLPSLCAMGNKHVEWCGQDAKSANVHPIKV